MTHDPFNQASCSQGSRKSHWLCPLSLPNEIEKEEGGLCGEGKAKKRR